MTDAERLSLLERIEQEARKFARKVATACYLKSQALDDALREYKERKDA